MSSQHDDRLQRALWSLEGLSIGDAFGERFSFARPHMFTARALPAPPWYYTDDTEMALSIVSLLRQRGRIDEDRLAASFARHFDPFRGYGAAMHHLLPGIAAGRPWREAAAALFEGQGSFGNGAAMRVAPLGAFFADDLSLAVDQARRSAMVTHAHPEGIAGAIAVAVAAACAWRRRESGRTARASAVLDQVLPHVPDSAVREGITQARALPWGASVHQAVAALGNGSRVTAQDTVPFVLWCAAQHLDDYEAALWLTASGLGDVDTTCAMVGGIVALHTGVEGIPEYWRNDREPLPAWPTEAEVG